MNYKFSEKLDFLMKLTNTQNSTLGRALSFDPSYIGRIRSGKRGLPKNQPFIEPAAAYFAKNLRDEYQRKSVEQAVCPGRPWPENSHEAVQLLTSWLTEDEPKSTYSANRPTLGFSAERTVKDGLSHSLLNPALETTTFFYGNEGKRRAVLAFLSDLCEAGIPVTMQVFSDEDMTWLYEDVEFFQKWASLLQQLIKQGSRLKTIHTVSRNIGEMLEGLRGWIPLYMSGSIEPYFYPKLRDQVFRRTLFIAKGRSALFSTSVGEATEGKLNVLLRDEGAVSALESEFYDYLRLCRPLMQIFNQGNREALWEALSAFEHKEGDCILVNSVPAYFTMPEITAQNVSSRSGKRFFLQHQRAARADFLEQLAKGYKVTEILQLPEPNLVRAGEVELPLCDLYSPTRLCYTEEEFRSHLAEILRLAKEEPNYHLIIAQVDERSKPSVANPLSGHFPQDVLITVKEDMGAFVSRHAAPTIVFGITESHMVAAFWSHFCRLAEEADCKNSVQKLEEYLERL